MNAYLTAYQYRPTRLEPLYRIARFYRETGQYDLAYVFARAAEGAGYPDDILFIERDIYEHGLPLERALACAGTGRRDEVINVLDHLLADARMAGGAKDRAWAERARLLGEPSPAPV